jgi:hypothetical protein
VWTILIYVLIIPLIHTLYVLALLHDFTRWMWSWLCSSLKLPPHHPIEWIGMGLSYVLPLLVVWQMFGEIREAIQMLPLDK